MKHRKLAIYIDQTRKNFFDFIKKVKEAGFDYICFQDSELWMKLNKRERLKKIEKINNLCKKINLIILAYHSCPVLLSLEENQKDNFKQHFDYIDELKNFGIYFWVLHNRSIKDEEKPWIKIKEIGKKKFDKLTSFVLKELCQYACQYNISIALENVPYLYTKKISDILEIIEKVDEENLGVCFDSGHSNICNLDLKKEILLCKDKLFTTHFHDNFGNRKKVFIDDKNISKYDLHLVPGLGTINWIEVNKTLNKIGYNYPVVFEGIKGINNEEELLKITVKLWRSFEKLTER
ncbi:MAG: sugar phosphate isomerase/epimerase [Candidatus Omnitrophica bacterium]|nr:sugar phosphate isomerase/epimerase [Candidatus Omnitrophota bacterium]